MLCMGQSCEGSSLPSAVFELELEGTVCHSIVSYPYYAWPARPTSSALCVGEDTGGRIPHLK